MKTYGTHQPNLWRKLADLSACAGLHHHTMKIIFRLLMVKVIDSWWFCAYA